MYDQDLPPALLDDITAVQRIPCVPRLLETTCRLTGMGFAAIGRLAEDRWVACSVRDTAGFGVRPGSELPVAGTICGELRRWRRPLLVGDVAQDARYRDHPAPARHGFRSYAAAPVILPDGTVFGTLTACDRAPRELGEELAGTLALFAELVALHLESRRGLATAAALLSQEREVAELREQFIAVLGHDLRNPLASVNAGVRLMLRHPERAEQLAQHVEQSVTRMAGLIDNVLDFARGRLGGGLALVRNAEEPLGPVLAQVVRELQTTHPERQVELELALREEVACDRTRMAQLLSNLVANALVHGAPDRPVHVQAAAEAGEFRLAVCNAGEAIPATVMGRLFQPFFRPGGGNRREGLGLGLYIAAEIARAHGGRIEVRSDAQETCFTLRMPTA